MKRIHFFAVVLIFISVLQGGCKQQESTRVTICTGDKTGVYYLIGAAICRIVNEQFVKYKIQANVIPTTGSVFNIDSVILGGQHFGIVQSDRLFQAYNGEAEWKEYSGEQKDLRCIFSLHPESITLIASEESKIRKVQDLKGKRVNLGNPGSGQLQNARDVLHAAGLTEEDLVAKYEKAGRLPGLLREGKLDAFFYTVGHPNINTTETTSGRQTVFIVPIKDSDIDIVKLRKNYPYAKTVIPISLYKYSEISNREDIETFGVRAIFVTSKKMDEDIVYAITKEVFESLEEFKCFEYLEQVCKDLTKEDMLKGLDRDSAPVHKGALRYYREADLDKYIDPKLIVD